jgi:hypothetical protein
MSGGELGALVKDLETCGFDCNEAVHFDAASHLLGVNMSGEHDRVKVIAAWLRGKSTPQGFMVWYRDPSLPPELLVRLHSHSSSWSYTRLKRKKWSWQFLAAGLVTGSMVSSWYQVFNIGHTADNRFWALQDKNWSRKIVAVAEVTNFQTSQVPEIALKLLRCYDEGPDDFFLQQMTKLGDIPLPLRKRKEQ